jgi:hypothetical protein
VISLKELEKGYLDPEIAFILNPVAGRGEVCGFWGAGARRNDTE